MIQIFKANMMKTQKASIQILSLLIMVLLTVSCSSDDGYENQAPGSFTLNEVTDGVDLQPQLTWETATDPDGDDVSYQVYLDTENPPQITVANNLGVSSFNLENALEPGTTYSWKVIAKDTEGNTTESDITSFTTRDKTNAEAIIGKWFFESHEGGTSFSECQKNGYSLFKENLIIEAKEYGKDNNGDCVGHLISATYEIIGTEIIKISQGTSNQTWEILSLTETTLVLDQGSQILTLKKE